MHNNPINFNDPSGHTPACDDGPKTWADCKKQLGDFATKKLKELGGSNDLEAMTQIVEKAAKLYKNYEDMIPALSQIFLGIEESNYLTVYNAATDNPNPCAAIGRPECNSDLYFEDAGFHRDFQDGLSQPFHFWAYLATSANAQGSGPASYLPGRVVSHAANVYHEYYQINVVRIQKLNLNLHDSGATWQDYALARAGMNIGTLVNMGTVSPDQLGNTIRRVLGDEGPGAFYVSPLKFLMPLDGN